MSTDITKVSVKEGEVRILCYYGGGSIRVEEYSKGSLFHYIHIECKRENAPRLVNMIKACVTNNPTYKHRLPDERSFVTMEFLHKLALMPRRPRFQFEYEHRSCLFDLDMRWFYHPANIDTNIIEKWSEDSVTSSPSTSGLEFLEFGARYIERLARLGARAYNIYAYYGYSLKEYERRDANTDAKWFVRVALSSMTHPATHERHTIRCEAHFRESTSDRLYMLLKRAELFRCLTVQRPIKWITSERYLS